MKRILFISALVMLFTATVQTAKAQYDPSASRELFDFSPFTDSGLLNLFYNAQQAGREYPTQAEFELNSCALTCVRVPSSTTKPTSSSAV